MTRSSDPRNIFCTSTTDALRFSWKLHKCHPTAIYINHLSSTFTYI